MKFSYKFSNLCGTVYKRGNILFTPNECLLSPVGNRITIFDLKNHKSQTLPFENVKNISRIALSPNGLLIITVDQDGKALLANMQTKTVFHRFNFKSKVYDIKFSPDGKYIAVTHQKHVEVWLAPAHDEKKFQPLIRHRTYTGHYDNTLCIDWSWDSRFFVIGSEDMTSRVYSTNPMEDFAPVTLPGHKSAIVLSCFTEKSLNIYTVSKDGALFIWHSVIMAASDIADGAPPNSEDTDSRKKKPKRGLYKWTKNAKHYFNQDRAEVTCATLHKRDNMLIVGFNTGVFTLYEVPDFNLIHSLSISQQKITTVAINETGEWLGFGCAGMGQLLVWEWQSQTYILKQQGHYYDMNVLSYSPDGQIIATGGDDGKVKLWNTSSGFCFVTFSEHNSSITGLAFKSNGQVVVSASLDGTVRAFDLIRYRNFRTFVSPFPTQFSCLGLDGDEIIAAGSHNHFDIYVWSMQTGKLLEILKGHEGPVSSLTFSKDVTLLASSSWDMTVRLWKIYEKNTAVECLQFNSIATFTIFSPSGKELAVATYNGELSFWNSIDAMQTRSIDAKADLGGGRSSQDIITAKKSAEGKCFNCLCYSADGEYVLAGGRSKRICIYNINQQVLLKAFEVSRNLSLDGIQEFLNSRLMTEAGPLDQLDLSDDSDKEDITLPGVTKGDMSSRKVRPEIRVKSLQFSPSGHSFAAATTEGLMIYSLDSSLTFDPYDLSIDVTPETIRQNLQDGNYLASVMLAFRLNEVAIIREIIENIKPDSIDLVCQYLPLVYVEKILQFVAFELETSRHLEFYLIWSNRLLMHHGTALKQKSGDIMPILISLQKSIKDKKNDLSKL
ncbi:uncharacterized protein TRIADDRAFT_50274 [Trichoplax adhaerens]|uniref:Small-subunit processome Utp12 domain-containing protein n=1 Tax=Trichoplax adhaerens TaxID=10228 RepID=B3RX86_TRIAD|nr:hypothetical protein TRIADDRAFT_50274 [Trichoplax adhaerens]EDV24827.1 hypothetical protein TRIADDRAFT_50274 [Trichoplax adhaerens]|eukprot:XP_002112717.1 hypothetical protein TRIADDRAFT_50274 [Trichoplax adhaerens]